MEEAGLDVAALRRLSKSVPSLSPQAHQGALSLFALLESLPKLI